MYFHLIIESIKIYSKFAQILYYIQKYTLIYFKSIRMQLQIFGFA